MADATPGVHAERAASLLAWFDRHRRPLPWRVDRDPYRIWLAEVLLQQTRVAQAIPYYERILARYPTVTALADASLEQVRKAWEGAGYYRRAEQLWRCARIVAGERGGRFPGTAAELAELPGIGPYTAAAVASLAFGEAVPTLDANAIRVAARWTGERGDPGRAAPRRRLLEELRRSLPSDRPGPFNEAVMELGETICRPRRPRCGVCPVRSSCAAGRPGGDPERFPRRPAAAAKPHHVAAIVVLERRGRWLVQRRPEAGLLPGLWEFPGGHLEPGESPEAAARRELREETGWTAGPLEALGVVRHGYSHFTVSLHVFRGPAVRGPRRDPGAARRRWVSPREFERLARPTATRKVARRLGASLRAAASPG